MHLNQLKPAKELLEDNMSWLSKEGSGKVRVRLIDLSSILDHDHGDLEMHAPIEDAISYAATSSDAIFEFVDAATYIDGQNEPDQKLVDKLTQAMGNIQGMLEEIPGYESDDYKPGREGYYYFLGVTNQGKGLIACVPEGQNGFDPHDPDIPF